MKVYENRMSGRCGVGYLLIALLLVQAGAAGCSDAKDPESADPLHVAQASMMAGTTQAGPGVLDRSRPEDFSEESAVEAGGEAADEFGAESDAPVYFETREAPTPYVMTVNWDEVDAYKRIDSASISKQVTSEIDVLPLPVLMPATPEFLEHAFAVTDDNWYTITADYGDHVVMVESSRIGFEYNGPNGREVEEDLVAGDFQVSRASKIASITFPAFGLIYLIEVSCLSPDTDKRCVQDDYIFSLANAMSVAGGAR